MPEQVIVPASRTLATPYFTEHHFEAVDGSMSLNIVISRQGLVSGRIAYVDEDLANQTIVMTTLAMR